MTQIPINYFWYFAVFTVMLWFIGAYYIAVTRNLIRLLIGMELMTKAVTILIVVAGYVTNNLPLAQAFAITLIILEVVVIAVAAGVVVNVFRTTKSIDPGVLRNLRG